MFDSVEKVVLVLLLKSGNQMVNHGHIIGFVFLDNMGKLLKRIEYMQLTALNYRESRRRVHTHRWPINSGCYQRSGQIGRGSKCRYEVAGQYQKISFYHNP